MDLLSLLFGGGGGGAGRGWVEAALLIGLFWAALAHPDRIRNLTEFRIATVLLGLSIIAPILVQIYLVGTPLGNPRMAGMGGMGAMGGGQDPGVLMYVTAIAPALTTLALVIGVDSVTPRSRSRQRPPEAMN